MANVKLVVIYPHPKDVDAFEKIYLTEHVPRQIDASNGFLRQSPPDQATPIGASWLSSP